MKRMKAFKKMAEVSCVQNRVLVCIASILAVRISTNQDVFHLPGSGSNFTHEEMYVLEQKKWEEFKEGFKKKKCEGVAL